MSCVLRATGSDFAVDTFLATSKLSSCHVFHKGEPKSKTKSEGQRNQSSGFNAGVSTADFSDLPGQIEEALWFLQNNESELKQLAEYSGVETVQLDFPVDQKDVAIQNNIFPPKLLLLCGQLGIELNLSLYMIFDSAD